MGKKTRREPVNVCEGCKKNLYEGDKYLVTEDNVALCKRCSPVSFNCTECSKKIKQIYWIDEETKLCKECAELQAENIETCSKCNRPILDIDPYIRNREHGIMCEACSFTVTTD